MMIQSFMPFLNATLSFAVKNGMLIIIICHSSQDNSQD